MTTSLYDDFLATKKYQLRYEIRNFFGSRFPETYLDYLYRKETQEIKQKIFRAGKTEIVIEGYPRTANTFAVVAFQSSQTKDIQIAHHLHIPAQVMQATKHKIPCLVLFRKPEDAITSFAIFAPKLTVKQALRGYVSFYESILHLHESYLLASFEEVIQDFGQVIKRLNDKFNTSFSEFHHTHENAEKCFRYIDDYTLKHQGGKILKQKGRVERSPNKRAIEHRISIPSSNRGHQKEALKKIYRSEQLTDLRDKAEKLYERLLVIHDAIA